VDPLPPLPFGEGLLGDAAALDERALLIAAVEPGLPDPVGEECPVA